LPRRPPRRHGGLLAMTTLLVLPFTGCMLATQKDMIQLDQNITQMRKNQADLISKMIDLSNNLENLNSELDSNQQRMTNLSQKMDDLQVDLQRRFNVLSGQVTGAAGQGASNPGDMYRLAYNDFQAGKFDLAIIGFRNFLAQYPRAELAATAQYNIGECEFARKNFLDAAREFDRVIQSYPRSEFAPRSLYKKGLALQQAGKKTESREVLRLLIKNYPHHELVKSARDILKESE
jgi:tol-pal system protein YbgF